MPKSQWVNIDRLGTRGIEPDLMPPHRDPQSLDDAVNVRSVGPNLANAGGYTLVADDFPGGILAPPLEDLPPCACNPIVQDDQWSVNPSLSNLNRVDEDNDDWRNARLYYANAQANSPTQGRVGWDYVTRDGEGNELSRIAHDVQAGIWTDATTELLDGIAYDFVHVYGTDWIFVQATRSALRQYYWINTLTDAVAKFPAVAFNTGSTDPILGDNRSVEAIVQLPTGEALAAGWTFGYGAGLDEYRDNTWLGHQIGETTEVAWTRQTYGANQNRRSVTQHMTFDQDQYRIWWGLERNPYDSIDDPVIVALNQFGTAIEKYWRIPPQDSRSYTGGKIAVRERCLMLGMYGNVGNPSRHYAYDMDPALNVLTPCTVSNHGGSATGVVNLGQWRALCADNRGSGNWEKVKAWGGAT